MENIIASILEIENNAKARLEEAEKKRNRIIADAKSEQENMVEAKIRKAEERLGKINSEEKKKAEEKLAEIEKLKDDEIRRLDSVFEKQRGKWEDEIFGAIING